MIGKKSYETRLRDGGTECRRMWKIRHSYGVFLYARETRQFLIIQNRDSHAFIYFFMILDLETWSDDRFRGLLEECTQDEIQRLLYFPSFENVYYDVYVKHDPVRYERQERIAQKNYQYFHSRSDWRHIAQQVVGKPMMWEFPKGRLSDTTEASLDCAFRELREETGIMLRPSEPYAKHLCDLKQMNLKPSLMKKTYAAFRAVQYIKHKPYIGQQVMVDLYGVMIDRPIPLRYRHFPRTIRSYSLSDECLHGRWVVWEEAIHLLPVGIVEVVEPMIRQLDRLSVTGAAPSSFIPCEVIAVAPADDRPDPPEV